LRAKIVYYQTRQLVSSKVKLVRLLLQGQKLPQVVIPWRHHFRSNDVCSKRQKSYLALVDFIKLQDPNF
jgi:hypothetical protein